MLSYSIWFSAPGFWMGGGLESLCVRCGWCRATAGAIRTVHSGSQDHHPSKNLVQKTICRNLTSSASDDGSIDPKHVEVRIHQ